MQQAKYNCLQVNSLEIFTLFSLLNEMSEMGEWIN